VSEILSLLSFGPGGWGDELASGLLLTLEICLFALPSGLLLGLLFGFAQRSDFATLREGSSLLTSLLRGVPELLTLLLVYYGGQAALNFLAASVGWISVPVNGFVAGAVALTLLFSAYSSEVFAGVLRTISRSSIEAAKSLGLGSWPTLIFITLPELFRLSLPGLSNLWLGMVKQTALVSIIGYTELLRASYIAASSTRRPILFYAIACLCYLFITLVSEFLLARFARELNRGRA
jgi:polar amino acid transport system permease protein